MHMLEVLHHILSDLLVACTLKLMGQGLSDLFSAIQGIGVNKTVSEAARE